MASNTFNQRKLDKIYQNYVKAEGTNNNSGVAGNTEVTRVQKKINELKRKYQKQISRSGELATELSGYTDVDFRIGAGGAGGTGGDYLTKHRIDGGAGVAGDVIEIGENIWTDADSPYNHQEWKADTEFFATKALGDADDPDKNILSWLSINVFEDNIGSPQSLVEFFFNMMMAYRGELLTTAESGGVVGDGRSEWFIPLPTEWTVSGGILDNIMISSRRAGDYKDELKKWGIPLSGGGVSLTPSNVPNAGYYIWDENSNKARVKCFEGGGVLLPYPLPVNIDDDRWVLCLQNINDITTSFGLSGGAQKQRPQPKRLQNPKQGATPGVTGPPANPIYATAPARQNYRFLYHDSNFNPSIFGSACSNYQYESGCVPIYVADKIGKLNGDLSNLSDKTKRYFDDVGGWNYQSVMKDAKSPLSGFITHKTRLLYDIIYSQGIYNILEPSVYGNPGTNFANIRNGGIPRAKGVGITSDVPAVGSGFVNNGGILFNYNGNIVDNIEISGSISRNINSLPLQIPVKHLIVGTASGDKFYHKAMYKRWDTGRSFYNTMILRQITDPSTLYDGGYVDEAGAMDVEKKLVAVFDAIIDVKGESDIKNFDKDQKLNLFLFDNGLFHGKRSEIGNTPDEVADYAKFVESYGPIGLFSVRNFNRKNNSKLAPNDIQYFQDQTLLTNKQIREVVDLLVDRIFSNVNNIRPEHYYRQLDNPDDKRRYLDNFRNRLTRALITVKETFFVNDISKDFPEINIYRDSRVKLPLYSQSDKTKGPGKGAEDRNMYLKDGQHIPLASTNRFRRAFALMMNKAILTVKAGTYSWDSAGVDKSVYDPADVRQVVTAWGGDLSKLVKLDVSSILEMKLDNEKYPSYMQYLQKCLDDKLSGVNGVSVKGVDVGGLIQDRGLEATVEVIARFMNYTQYRKISVSQKINEIEERYMDEKMAKINTQRVAEIEDLKQILNNNILGPIASGVGVSRTTINNFTRLILVRVKDILQNYSEQEKKISQQIKQYQNQLKSGYQALQSSKAGNVNSEVRQKSLEQLKGIVFETQKLTQRLKIWRKSTVKYVEALLNSLTEMKQQLAGQGLEVQTGGVNNNSGANIEKITQHIMKQRAYRSPMIESITNINSNTNSNDESNDESNFYPTNILDPSQKLEPPIRKPPLPPSSTVSSNVAVPGSVGIYQKLPMKYNKPPNINNAGVQPTTIPSNAELLARLQRLRNNTTKIQPAPTTPTTPTAPTTPTVEVRTPVLVNTASITPARKKLIDKILDGLITRVKAMSKKAGLEKLIKVTSFPNKLENIYYFLDQIRSSDMVSYNLGGPVKDRSNMAGEADLANIGLWVLYRGVGSAKGANTNLFDLLTGRRITNVQNFNKVRDLYNKNKIYGVIIGQSDASRTANGGAGAEELYYVAKDPPKNGTNKTVAGRKILIQYMKDIFAAFPTPIGKKGSLAELEKWWRKIPEGRKNELLTNFQCSNWEECQDKIFITKERATQIINQIVDLSDIDHSNKPSDGIGSIGGVSSVRKGKKLIYPKKKNAKKPKSKQT